MARKVRPHRDLDPDFQQVDDVRWGKGGLHLQVGQGVHPSSKPRFKSGRDWKDLAPHFWLAAGILAALIGVFAVRGYMLLQPTSWPIITGNQNTIYYGTIPLQSAGQNGEEQLFSGPIALAVDHSPSNSGFFTVIYIGGTEYSTFCPNLTPGSTSVDCSITKVSAGTTTTFRTVDQLINNNRCWQRQVYNDGNQLLRTLTACASGSQPLLPWAVPAGVAGNPG